MTQSAPKAQISATPLPRDRSALVQALLRGVEGIAPIIARNKAASEHARTLAPEVVEAMRDTGLLMMKSPYEVGGAEIHPVDQMAVVEAVTYLDSAAAWSMFIAATVTGVEQLGTESYLHCRTSLDEPITVHQRCQTTTKKRKSIILSNDARALRVFDPETGQSCLKCKVPPYRA